MTPEQEAELLRTVTRTGVKMDMLVSDDGSRGQVPELRAGHEELRSTVGEQGKQIAYWKGAIAVVGVLLLALGGAVLAHVLGGK